VERISAAAHNVDIVDVRRLDLEQDLARFSERDRAHPRRSEPRVRRFRENALPSGMNLLKLEGSNAAAQGTVIKTLPVRSPFSRWRKVADGSSKPNTRPHPAPQSLRGLCADLYGRYQALQRPQVFVPCWMPLQLKCGPGPRSASITAARHSRLTGRIGGIGATSGSAVGGATE
jgi:hypothetical protein